ncbi:MAG: Ig-like domain-containing protein [SAR324 cluster bacterium]|nr:Ig-like domain-containing protein [SAR324 cluster bacterium]
MNKLTHAVAIGLAGVMMMAGALMGTIGALPQSAEAADTDFAIWNPCWWQDNPWGRDDKAGSVNMVNPKDGASGQPVTSRVGLTFTDQVDLASVDLSTVIVRRRGALAPLPGRFSHQTGIVNFWPDAPLAPNAVYEVLVPAGGVRDYAGNATPTGFSSLFSTGGAIPYRMRFCSPSIKAFHALPTIIEGSMLSDAVAVLATLNVIAGELDR